MNRSSATSADAVERQMTQWSVIIALAQLICFGSLWFAPLNVHLYVAGLQALHLICFFIYKPNRTLADAITLTRSTITSGAAYLAIQTDTLTAELWLIFLLALLLDGADGWIARKKATGTIQGAIFDMETDGLWVSLLSLTLVALGIEPSWILILGLWRPVYALVSVFMPKVGETHPKGTWFGKTVFVTVGVVLLVASSPWRVFFLTKILLGIACVLLSVSFIRSIAQHVQQVRVVPQ